MSVLRAVLVAALLAVPAGAHDFWIEPETYTPAAGQALGLGLRVGEAFHGEALPRIPSYVERFVVRGGAGERQVGGRPGGEPAGRLDRVEPGLQVALYQSRPYVTDVEGPTFDRYVVEEGLDGAAALRRQRGETGRATRERFSRCAKVLLRADASAAGAPASTAFGCPLELVPEADPTVAGVRTLPVRVLLAGKPQRGALVVARNRETPAETVRARTDAAGRVRLRLTRGGVWMVKSIHLQPAPEGSGVTWESFWASLTFQSPAP